MSILVEKIDETKIKIWRGTPENQVPVPMEVRDYGRVVILVASFFILNIKRKSTSLLCVIANE
jgi:hypothetical protein